MTTRPGQTPGGGATLPSGTQLGRYEIVSWIASGGMASVYKARALGIAGFERLLAIKVLHPHLAHEPEFVSMFLDEARLAARIRHPNVVATLDIAASEADGYYLAMEYVEGHHFGRLLQSARGRLPAPVVLRVIADALAGLGAAHDLVDADGQPLQLVHRDVSPHNLLVGIDGIARLTDFGVARAEVRLAATTNGQFKGKLGYLAPEQIAEGACDRRSDLFAMGVVLWEALAGRRLFKGDDTVGMLRSVLQAPIAPLSSLRPELAPLDPLLARALARDPAHRFQTAQEFLEALERVAPAVGGLAPQRNVGDLVRRFVPPAPPDNIPLTRTGRTTPLQHHLIYGGTGSGISRPPAPPVLEPKGKERFGRKTLLVALGAALLALGAAAGVLLLAGRGKATLVESASAAPVEAESLTATGDVRPTLAKGSPPPSPDPALGLAPTVVVRLHVRSDGTVAESSIYRPRADLRAFEVAALDAVQGWRFHPARKAGAAVPSWINWPVTFGPAVAPTTVLRIKGSDTIGAALAPALARAWHVKHPEVRIDVEAAGSSTAFTGLFDGTADLGAASRPVEKRELEEAGRLGLRFEEFVIGYDGVAVIVHPSNDRVRWLTLDQLRRIFTGAIRDWSEVGGAPGPIHRLSRPSNSGTHAFFREKALRGEAFAPATEMLEHNDRIVAQVAADPLAIGYVGLGAVGEGDRVVPVAPSPGRPAIPPSRDTIVDGSYPLYRPLLLYTRGRPRGEAARFLRFVLSEEGKRIVEAHGFVGTDVAAVVEEERL